MERLCRRCQKPHRRKGLTEYCSSECRNAAIERQCENPLCRTMYVPKNMARPNKYCSIACALVANRAKAEQGAKKWRVATREKRPVVFCKLSTCPRPDEPVPMSKEEAERTENHYHKPDCLREFWNQGGASKGKGQRRPQDAQHMCETCGKVRTYWVIAARRPRNCRTCARKLKRSRVRAATVERRCGYSQCGKLLHVSAYDARTRETSHCSRAHYQAARHERATVQVRCTACGEQRDYRLLMIPGSVDQVTMTWVCTRCRPHKSAMRLLTCAHCEQPFQRRIKLGGAEGLHFCGMGHFLEYHRERRRMVVCRACGNTTRRRQGGFFCDSTCYGVWLAKQSRPERAPSAAEARVIQKWKSGIRGVRHLALAAGVSTTTVLKLRQTGKLVEPTATRSA